MMIGACLVLHLNGIDKAWGPHTVDHFASYYNTKLPRFNSRFWNPGAEGVDSFTINWHGENNWLCPPIYLIPHVIHHAQKCAASGTLVVPEWPSAPFWPKLFPEVGRPAKFFKDVQVLTPVEFTIFPGRRGSSLFKGPPNTNIMALRLVFPQVMETCPKGR